MTVRRKLSLLPVVVAALLALAAAPALAGTWTVSPTVINESSNTVALGQTSIDTTGRFTTQPPATLPPGDYPGDNGNQGTFTYIAPDLDEGADAGAVYNMHDGSEYTLYTQDDVDGIQVPDNPAGTCVLADPTGPTPDTSCAATYPNLGTPPTAPDPSQFSLYYNFRDDASPPTANEGASVTAAGQVCQAWLAPGQSATCTASAPTQNGFSPTDPSNYQALYFISQGNAPVTITDTDPFMATQQQNDPNSHNCVSMTPQALNCTPSTSCTMSAWSQTCMLQTSGGANSVAVLYPDESPQIGQQVSDQITIAPAAGATQSAWYGVKVYAQSAISRNYVYGVTIFDAIANALEAFGQLLFNGGSGPSFNWNPGSDIGNGEDSDGDAVDVVQTASTLRPGATLAPGRSLRRGPFTLTMQPSGSLVEQVAENGHRFPVWSSRTQARGAHATLRRDANLVIRDQAGRARWSTRTHGAPPARLELANDGRVLVHARGRKPLFSTHAVSYPLAVRPGSSALVRELMLAPGDHLQNGRSRLTMKTNGNLVLSRARRVLWTSRTAGHLGAYAHLHHGRLVIATPQTRVVWASGKDRGRAARLTLRRSGALMLTSAQRTLWGAPARME
ncbi:MAG TPA: hypothetical protein VGM91_16220 [Conexibacter sp.]